MQKRVTSIKKNINNLLKKYKGWNLSIKLARKLTNGTKLHDKISQKELNTQKQQTQKNICEKIKTILRKISIKISIKEVIT